MNDEKPLNRQHSLKFNWEGITPENILKILNSFCGLVVNNFTDSNKMGINQITKKKPKIGKHVLDAFLMDNRIKTNYSYFGLLKLH
jgi:hypothetical protein